MPYSAGTAYLQVVPSFLNIEAAIGRQAAQMGKAFDDGIAKGAEDGLKRAADKAENAARAQGDVYGGQFANAVRQRMAAAIRSLPRPRVDADLSPFDRAVERLRTELRSFRNEHIGLQVDDATAEAAVAGFAEKLRQLESAAPNVSQFVNVHAAREQIDALSALSQEARDKGLETGGAYGGAFGTEAQRRIDAALKALPTVEITTDSSEAERAVAELREQLVRLRDERINLHLDDAEVLARLAEVRAQLKAMSESTRSIPIKADVDAALKQLDAFAKSVDAEGEKAAQQYAGAFITTVQQRLAAALKSLPTVEITADSSEAQAKLAEVRAEIAGLAGKTIGVDVSTAEATAKVEDLKARLLALARDKKVDVQVRTDAAAAAAELLAVSRLQKDLDSKVTSLKVDRSQADSAGISMARLAATFNLSAGQLALLIPLGPALGAALVPAALSAAAAVASLGAAAVASAVAVKLAFSGVGTAVKDMQAVQDAAAQSADQQSVAQDRVAQATDAVASAERSLANTRESVASGQVNAARQVTDAERSLADAQHTALEAQQALTDAYQSARRAQEDLANQVKDNSLAQRQAVIDVADAKTNLDKVMADPAATQQQRTQAQLTFDQRTQQLAELELQGRRLAQDQVAADKAGIEGSKQVVQARNQVRSANEGVTKGQEALTAAQKAQADQARQGSFQILQAQQAVTAAQRQLQDATVRAGNAGNQAMENLQIAMSKLSPPAQEFARFIFGLKPELDSLRAASAAGLLPGVESGIKAMLPALPQITGDIRFLSGELGHLADEAGHAFGSPYWQGFIHQMVGQAVPALELAGHTIGSFAIGLAGLTRALLPLGQQLGAGVLNFADRFAVAANNLGSNSKFQQVIDYVRVNGPEAAHVVAQLAETVVHLGAVFGPLGADSLPILRLLLQTIDALPLGPLQAIAQVIPLIVLGMKGWDLIGRARDFELFRTAVGSVSSVLSTASTAWKVAGIDGAGTLAKGLASVQAASSQAYGGLTRLAVSLGAGGTLGLALAGAAILIGPTIGYFERQAKTAQEVRTQADSLSGTLRGLANNYQGLTRSSKDYLDNLVRTDPQFRDFVLNAHSIGVSVDTITQALNGNKDALHQIDDAYTHQINMLQAYHDYLQQQGSDVQHNKAEEKAFQDVLAHHPELAGKTAEQVQNLVNQVKAQKDATDQTSDSIFRQNTALQILGISSGQVNADFARLDDAFKKVGQESGSTADKIGALKDAEDNLDGATKNVADAQHAFAGGSLALRDALAQANAQGANARNITDDYTRAGHDVNDVLTQQVQNARDVYNATLAQTGSVTDANQAYEDYLAKIQADIDKSPLDQAEKAKVRDRLQEIIDTQGKIPTDPKVMAVKLIGDDSVKSRMEALAILQRSLTMGVSLEEAKKQYDEEQRINTNMGHLATGGPVYGAGTETSDSIPAYLSHNEHVWTAAEVRAAGGHAAVQELRKMVLAGQLPPPHTRYPGDGYSGIAYARGGAVLGFAAGGGVFYAPGMPFPVDVSHTKVPTLAQVMAAARYGPTYTGPLSDRANFLVSWLHDQAGKPYIWDSAGPYGYDCSGLQSAARNILTDAPIYNHTFSTFDEGNFFTKPGWGMYTVGWTNPGERGPGGNSVGHTAGKIGNLPFEARGGDGVVLGATVTPLASFAHLAHFADGGPVEVKPILADDGAWLAPGLNPPVLNSTGRPEPIVPPDVFNALTAAAAAPSPAGNTYNFAFRDTTLTPAHLRAMQDRDAAIARIGRPR